MLFSKKNHTGKALKRGKSQFELYQAQVRATCTQNLQAHLFFTETKLRDKQPQARTFANLLIRKIIGAREVFHSFFFFFFFKCYLFTYFPHLAARSSPSAAERTSITKSGRARASRSTQLRGQQACSQSPEMTWLQKLKQITAEFSHLK